MNRLLVFPNEHLQACHGELSVEWLDWIVGATSRVPGDTTLLMMVAPSPPAVSRVLGAPYHSMWIGWLLSICQSCAWSFNLFSSQLLRRLGIFACICLLAIWIPSFVNTVLVQGFCHSSTRPSGLFLVIWRHSFHVLDTSPLRGTVSISSCLLSLRRSSWTQVLDHSLLVS